MGDSILAHHDIVSSYPSEQKEHIFFFCMLILCSRCYLAIFELDFIKFTDALRPDCHIGGEIAIFSVNLEIFCPILVLRVHRPGAN